MSTRGGQGSRPTVFTAPYDGAGVRRRTAPAADAAQQSASACVPAGQRPAQPKHPAMHPRCVHILRHTPWAAPRGRGAALSSSAVALLQFSSSVLHRARPAPPRRTCRSGSAIPDGHRRRRAGRGQPLDTVWGIGLGVDNERAADPARWRGQNLLGFALMETRDEIARVWSHADLVLTDAAGH